MAAKKCEFCKAKIKGEGITFSHKARDFGWFCNNDHLLQHLVDLNIEATDRIKRGQ